MEEIIAMLEILVGIDGGILLWIQEHLRFAFLNGPVIFYTTLSNRGELWLALSLLMLFFASTRRTGFLSLCSVALGALATNVTIKPLVERIRPYEVVEGLVPLLTSSDPFSFPSGHTCAAFAAAMIWCRGLPQRWMRVTGAVMAVLMGFSRLYVGVHYPTDVLAGALIGSLSAWAVWRLGEKWKP